ncbi:hypothetical protein F9B85_12980 [Heliorestis acidaminivorans]|uniref:PRC-barrel domain-containing protein n=1 Tax=Heliorestis acidaminivorans TaxID=553427 RepID=A0A6I0ERH3_9FIRM|nr:PRC-barrel domain-containing protein [Heliorestis acidaminivorans]KAB2951276.1 hypothetical protein F9B85_12980 [Heliorestis acidaminivorans]
MLKGRDLLQRPLLESPTGKVLGHITDLVIETEKAKITGLAIETEDHKRKKLLWNKIHIEDDLIYLTAKLDEAEEKEVDEVQEAHEEQERPEVQEESKSLNLSQLRGHNVTTESGKELGEVGDIIFDKDHGKIVALEVSDGLFQDLLTGRLQLPWPDIIHCTTEDITVSNDWKDAW